MKTQAFSLSPVDIDALPGLAEICQGRLPAAIRRGLEQAITDAADPRTIHDIARKVAWTLALLPDADGGSAVWSLPKPVSVTLAAGHLPPAGRVLFGKEKGVLKVRALGADEGSEDDIQHETPRTVELGVSIGGLIAGNLDVCFKRESIVLLLDVDDGRKVAAAVRSISFEILVIADEDRSSVHLLLKPPKHKLAPYREEEHSGQRLFLNNGRAELEPDVHLPGEDEPRQQAAINDPSVFQPKRT